MDASGTISGATRKQRQNAWKFGEFWARDWKIALAASSGMLLLAFSVLVAFRRVWGGLQSAPGVPVLIAVSLLLATLAAAIHYGSQSLLGKNSLKYYLLQGVIPLSLLISAFSICVPGSPLLGVLAIVAILGTEELFWIARPQREATPAISDRPVPLQSPPPLTEGKKETGAADFVSDFPAEVLRRIERTRGPGGEDICWGQVRTTFQAGQRTAPIHIVFCPPFAVIPTLHFEQVEGPDASVKATQILPYGARLEVRLARTESMPTDARIEFSAIDEASEVN
ncbi:MAG: hypothetical protein P8K78_04400 [Pirellulales bacterium]|nr:hypothetical protein [Pirellulales bacterium]